MRQREFARRLGSLPAGAPRPPSPAEPTINTLLDERADRFLPGAWSASHDGLHERAALRRSEQQQTRSMTSRKRCRDPLPTLLAKRVVASPFAHQRFVCEDALRIGVCQGTPSTRPETRVFTERDLFDQRHSELGGERTLFGAFSALCRSVSLLDVVSRLVTCLTSNTLSYSTVLLCTEGFVETES